MRIEDQQKCKKIKGTRMAEIGLATRSQRVSSSRDPDNEVDISFRQKCFKLRLPFS